MQKQLYMIGGPNGAGKTTSAFALLPELLHCEEYVNADAIAASLSPFKPESTAIQAGKLMLNRIYTLANKGANFAFETTMSSKTFAKFLDQCKNNNYHISLLYLWLPSAELAVSRVKQRVATGGHNIPEADIRRRYIRSIENFKNLYIPICDRWILYDNSSETPKIIAKKHKKSENLIVFDKTIWNKFNENNL